MCRRITEVFMCQTCQTENLFPPVCLPVSVFAAPGSSRGERGCRAAVHICLCGIDFADVYAV